MEGNINIKSLKLSKLVKNVTSNFVIFAVANISRKTYERHLELKTYPTWFTLLANYLTMGKRVLEIQLMIGKMTLDNLNFSYFFYIPVPVSGSSFISKATSVQRSLLAITFVVVCVSHFFKKLLFLKAFWPWVMLSRS